MVFAKIGALAVLCVTLVLGQGAVPTALSTPSYPEVKQFFVDGSGNLQYICTARQKTGQTTVKRTDATLTNIAVSSNTATLTTASAHNLYVGARVTVSGATVDTDLNATYTILTVPSATTYTFTTVAVSNATYTESTLVVTTDFPLLSGLLWSIQVYQYSATSVMSGSLWAASNVAYNLACSNRATY